jgi:hypothetical protein
MTLTLDVETRDHLECVRDGVAREFERLPESEVNERFDAIVAQLLSEASIPDYVPVLAWRYSRETLRSDTPLGLPAEFRTDT